MSETAGKIWKKLSMPISWTYIALLAITIFGLSVLFYSQIENFFIFYPESEFETLPTDWGLSYEDVFFLSDGEIQIHGWYFPLKPDTPVILFCHGNAGNISHRLENVKLLVDQGLSVLIFDYRGYGKSEGKPTESGLYADGLAAYSFLVGHKHIRPSDIIPFGRSLGSSVAIEIALKRKVRSLIIESAFTSTKDMAKTLFLFRPFSFLMPVHYDNLKKIAAIRVPKLVIHGKRDEIVPFHMGERLYQAAPKPKRFFPVKGGGHNDTYLIGGRKYFETISAFAKTDWN